MCVERTTFRCEESIIPSLLHSLKTILKFREKIVPQIYHLMCGGFVCLNDEFYYLFVRKHFQSSLHRNLWHFFVKYTRHTRVSREYDSNQSDLAFICFNPPSFDEVISHFKIWYYRPEPFNFKYHFVFDPSKPFRGHCAHKGLINEKFRIIIFIRKPNWKMKFIHFVSGIATLDYRAFVM